MENKILAIRGHNTRGKEVIEILKMLGGESRILKGNDTHCFYYISTDNNIIRLGHANYCNLNDFVIFTLEEFLEKYPFKVGDKCKYNGRIYFYRQQKFVTISNMGYVNDTILYKIDKGIWVKAEDLQPYEEEIKAEDRLEIYADPAIDNNSKTAIDIFVSNESLGLKNGYIANKVEIKDCGIVLKCVKNKPQYPKTYEECYQITKKVAKTIHELDMAYNPNLIYDFQKLLICRDAYWKFEGDWEEKRKKEINHYVIYSTLNGGLVKDCLSCTMVKHLLDFPTKEMRDAFYENFKDLIEQCKEFL